MSYDPRHPHLHPGNWSNANRETMTAPRADVAPAPTQLADTPPGPSEAPPPASGDEFDAMNVGQLRKAATARGIKYRGLDRDALLEALRA